MCGRATLAIVVSRPCMMLASMIEKVIAPRLAGPRKSPLTAPLLRGFSLRRLRRPRAGEPGENAVDPREQRPPVTRIDLGGDAEPGMQRSRGKGPRQAQSYR